MNLPLTVLRVTSAALLRLARKVDHYAAQQRRVNDRNLVIERLLEERELLRRQVADLKAEQQHLIEEGAVGRRGSGE